MFHKTFLLTLLMLAAGCSFAHAKPQAFIVENGRANAQIVIADDAVTVIEYAAKDLQHYVKKITGAELPIVTAPTRDANVQIFVGDSSYTRERGVNVDDLNHGAFRMLSGDNWLILAGRDIKFQPEGLMAYATSSSREEKEKHLYDKFDEITGGTWSPPFGQVWKQVNPNYDLAEQDEKGSFNAVAAYLRSLGVRWYMPGDIGEVVPQAKSVALPEVDKTVTPDFAFRYPYVLGQRFGQTSLENILWHMRMGLNQGIDLLGVGNFGHGMDYILSLENRENHPEYFALFAGKRANDRERGRIMPCLSSQGFFQENVAYVQALFEVFDFPMASVIPPDGFARLCQCELCEGKGSPELGWYGALSNYVWNYTNNIAKAIEKTHPDRRVQCLGYSTYSMPPSNIDQFSPNLGIGLAQLRSSMNVPSKRKLYTDMRAAWLEKMPEGKKEFVYIYEYYLEAMRKQSKGLPAYYPHTIAMDLKSLKGISRGEFVEVLPQGPVYLNLYVTTRMWWDADQDVDALLDEYYTQFYGPAAQQMKAFVEYSEANWRDVPQSSEKIDRVCELIAAAENTAPADSVYAQRIAVIADYMAPLEGLQKQLAVERDNKLLARFVPMKSSQVRIDGKLDDYAWGGHLGPSHLDNGRPSIPHASGGLLKDLITGETPKHQTKFATIWVDGDLVIGIKCEDDGSAVNVGTKVDYDTNIWNGDCIEVLIETQANSYYQITLNPAGAIYEIDRGGSQFNALWRSGATYATYVGEDGWSAEIRIPLADEMQDAIDVDDAFGGMKGKQPSSTYPWYFNICRQRVRDDGTEFSAFAPTGKENFHDKTKFAKLHRKGL